VCSSDLVELGASAPDLLVALNDHLNNFAFDEAARLLQQFRDQAVPETRP
jgi:hypothetical protein